MNEIVKEPKRPWRGKYFSPYLHGVAARLRGGDCPFPRETPEHHRWEAGWYYTDLLLEEGVYA